MRKKILIIILFLLGLGLGIGVFLFFYKLNPKEVKNLKKEAYSFYVNINSNESLFNLKSTIILTANISYYECLDDANKAQICDKYQSEITNVDFRNENDRDIYKDLDLTKKSLEEAVNLIIDESLKNKIEFNEIMIETNFKYYDILKETIKPKQDIDIKINLFSETNEQMNNADKIY